MFEGHEEHSVHILELLKVPAGQVATHDLSVKTIVGGQLRHSDAEGPLHKVPQLDEQL